MISSLPKRQPDEPGARERILAAAEEMFAEAGFDATPTSRIAERAGVPKGLVHYYFKRKPDLLTALVERLPEETIDPAGVVVPGDVAGSLRRLVDALDRTLDSSALLSHLLWREADTHQVVLDALQARFRRMVDQVRAVLAAARTAAPPPTSTARRTCSHRPSATGTRWRGTPRPGARRCTVSCDSSPTLWRPVLGPRRVLFRALLVSRDRNGRVHQGR